MRGRGGEELELLEAAQRDVVEARDAASQFRASLEQITAENSQLQTEIETMRNVKNTAVIHEPMVTQSPAETNNETQEDVTQERNAAIEEPSECFRFATIGGGSGQDSGPHITVGGEGDITDQRKGDS